MITYLLGLPGSGKSYFAVDRIYNNFSDDKEAIRDKKVTFKNCFTNINEFQFDKVKNVYPLDFDYLYEILKELHGLYKAKKTDKELIEFLETKELLNTLFVIDEAHNHFDKKDIVLVWWLSYHRHLFHEIILITQNLGLIESKYKAFSEFFYVAKPQSLSLTKSHFKYNIYCSSRLSKNSHSGNIKVKRKQSVFALYHSGDSINTSNVILKFLLIALFFALLMASIMYYFASSKKVETEDSGTTEIQENIITSNTNTSRKIKKNTPIKEDEEEIIDFSNSKTINFSCSFGNCSYKDFSIPPKLLFVYVHNNSLKLLYKEKINQNLTEFYFYCSEDFYDYLIPKKKEKYNEDTQEHSSLNLFGGDTPSK